MNKLYMGIDIGSVLTKGVIIDLHDNIIASAYSDTLGDPIKAVKNVVMNMRSEIDFNNYQVVAVGTTGSARKLIGRLLDASVIKNEITAQAVGTLKLYPNVRTIFEMGGQDSKIICLNNGVVTDYAMNTFCAAGTGTFISSLAERLGISVEDMDNMALNSKKRVNITAKCAVFAESDLIRKIQAGYKKEDIINGLLYSIAFNYIDNVAKGKKILTPIVFNGGVSRNATIVRAFEELTGEKINVNRNSQLMGAFGMAIMARDSGVEHVFDFNIEGYNLETKIASCGRCSNNCEIVTVYKNNKLIDYWGNKCSQVNEVKNV